MKVRLLEDHNGIKVGEIRDFPDEVAKWLISKGVAVKAIDKEAHDSLDDAKLRDRPKE